MVRIQIQIFINYGLIKITNNKKEEEIEILQKNNENQQIQRNEMKETKDNNEIHFPFSFQQIQNEEEWKEENNENNNNQFFDEYEKTEEIEINENETNFPTIQQAQLVPSKMRRLSTFMNTKEQTIDFIKLNNRQSSLNFLQEELNLEEIQKECFILFDSYQNDINSQHIHSQLEGRNNLYFILMSETSIYGWYIQFFILPNKIQYQIEKGNESYFFSGKNPLKLKKEYLSERLLSTSKTYFILNQNNSISLCEWKNLLELKYDKYSQLILNWNINNQLCDNIDSQQKIQIQRLFIFSI